MQSLGRFLLCCAVGMLSAAAGASPPLPPAREDSASRIREDFEAIARDYSLLSNPTDEQLTALNSRLEFLQQRCHRLNDKDYPEVKTMRGVIAESQQIVVDRARLEEERRKNEVKPYVFGPIADPTLRAGGHTEKGITCLMVEVEEFLKHFRDKKRRRQSDNDAYVEPSRAYFRRTIQMSIETAQRQLKAPRSKNDVAPIPNGGFAYDHYSPQENLRWALAVARIAEGFDLKVGGSAEAWRELQTKILSLAASYNIGVN